MKLTYCMLMLFAAAAMIAAPAYCREIEATNPIFTGDMDICGRDPQVNAKMIENPGLVIEYLENHEDNKQIQERLRNHPFIQKVEAGKLTKDELRDDVVANLAYHLDRQVRNFGQALNNFGNAWPVIERRDIIGDVLDMHRGELRRLGQLAASVGIDDMDALLKAEPNERAQVLSSHMAEIVNHARDVAEGVAPIRVILRTEKDNRQRIQKALRENGAYRGFDLKGLDFFDVDCDEAEFNRRLDKVVRQALNDGITLCELRRRMNQVNMGMLRLYDAMNGERGVEGAEKNAWF